MTVEPEPRELESGESSTQDPVLDETPPFLGSWRRVYAAVIGFLALLILLFYWFGRVFTPR